MYIGMLFRHKIEGYFATCHKMNQSLWYYAKVK